ncbi:MAG: polymer-forming cytoskeletal protein [Hyphomicrobiaceae bacterium]
MKQIQPTIIDADTHITGRMDDGENIEIHGMIEGELSADTVIVHPGGSVIGKLVANHAEVHGVAQGEISIRNLIDIASTGDVSGTVHYGQLSLAPGGCLSASVRNVPPTLAGDLDLTVMRGNAVTITTRDLYAIDPDDAARDLTFSISNQANGWLAMIGALSSPVHRFTQADLLASKVAFVHDGTNAPTASFDVALADAAGASAGAPKKVTIYVQ